MARFNKCLLSNVSDFREVKMKILQFDADVRVIRPTELQAETQVEIVKMMTVYGRCGGIYFGFFWPGFELIT